MSIKVGIFFGGPSREREISFAGGRTVYDNLDKSLFEAVPIFVDSFRNWYLLDWAYLYKGSIRDFFPLVSDLPDSPNHFQVYQESLGPLSFPDFEQSAATIGRLIPKYALNELIDIAFLALHGEYGEDGQLQVELEKLGMPYTGSGVRACQVGIDKALQKELMAQLNFPTPPIKVLEKTALASLDLEALYDQSSQQIGWPLVVRPAKQGSSIGVSIVEQQEGFEGFKSAIERAFFQETIPLKQWRSLSEYEQIAYIKLLTDLRDGLGLPIDACHENHKLTIYHPEDLLKYLQEKAQTKLEGTVFLEAHHQEDRVILEGFIRGKEFSCIVLRTEDGGCIALPPTEIKKGQELFDYRSKYLPGLSRKVTPIELPSEKIEAIRKECERLFQGLGFGVYARIDGFYGNDGHIYLNDPNTTSGMLPSSFFFHQAAEIGLNPSQFLTAIIDLSLWERSREGNHFATELKLQLEEQILQLQKAAANKKQVAVLLGGSSFERHISVESGRNIFEKLASSDKYSPLPIFLTSGEGVAAQPSQQYQNGEDEQRNYGLYQLPINLLLKDNADDIRDKVLHFNEHPILASIRQLCQPITTKYAGHQVSFSPKTTNWDELAKTIDAVFIALHGRPGEDGQVQIQLEARKIPFNGSGVSSSNTTINKFNTLQKLKAAGFPVAKQWLAPKSDFLNEENAFYDKVEHTFGFPLIAKPVDDGCSAAVKLIKNQTDLQAYCRLMFSANTLDEQQARKQLRLKEKEEFPQKNSILFEELITAKNAVKFLEITGGMLTSYENGECLYAVFEPSEALAGGEVLSLEEKFLAGEGQNLTPARLYTSQYSYEHIASQVKKDLAKAAKILNVEGYCRIDAFVRIFENGQAETIIIEVNSLPGMTPATAIFHQAALAGLQPYQFIDRLLEFGFQRTIRQNNPAATTIPPALSPPRDHTLVATNKPLPTLAKNTNTMPLPAANIKKTSFLKSFGARLLALLKHLSFWKNVAALLTIFLLAFFGLRACLSIYTHHGEAILLPLFEGKQLEEAKRIAKDRDLEIQVIKGAFDPDRDPGLVVAQQPKAQSRVKRNRSIYLTVLSDEAPMVQLPSLVGSYDYEQYTRRLDPLKISYYIAEQVYDPKQEENSILHFFYDEQKIEDQDLRKGVKVPQGSRLGFVVTVRRTGKVSVPNLRCRTYGEALFVIGGYNLEIGEASGVSGSLDEAYIERTEPPSGQSVDEGTAIRVFLSRTYPDNCD